MDTHSLVLLSGSALDHTHIHNATARRTAPPLRGSRRPFRHIAQGLARILPQLRQLSQRLRRAPAHAETDVPCVRTWHPASEEDAGKPLTSGKAFAVAHPAPVPPQQHHRTARWRTRKAQRVKPHNSPELPRSSPEQVLEQTVTARDDAVMSDEQDQQQALLAELPAKRGPLRRLARLLRHVGSHVRPTGPGENDKNLPERVLNVVTCGMFFQAGSKIIRLCRSVAARRFGWAFIAVGVIATVYHGSWGRFRNHARKVDYYSIAVSSLMLRSAVVGAVPRWLTAAMVTAIPFKPSLVSTSNFMAVEVRYLLLALTHRHLRAEWAAHTGMSTAATAFFTLEETPLLSWFPYAHAAFHALSAGAFLTLPSALNHITGELAGAAAA